MSDKPKCFNRPHFHDKIRIQDGWHEDGRANFVIIPQPMTKNCHQNEAPFGEAYIHGWDCEGCEHCTGAKSRVN